MPSSRHSNHTNQAARATRREGCLFVFLIPPAAIIVIGFIVLLATGQLKGQPPAQPYGPGSTAQPGVLAPFFSKSVLFWGESIEQWAKKWDLDANLIATVMQIESCGDPEAVSRAGASGLFQVMPFHFKDGENPIDPETNALRGLNYLKSSLKMANGDIRQALVGYNGGVSLIGIDETQWPDETSQYAYWGNNIYLEAQQGSDQSKTLAEWLNKGGARLCTQARRRLGIQN
jgi:soluble lytic murein transglycosylase-like protein